MAYRRRQQGLMSRHSDIVVDEGGDDDDEGEEEEGEGEREARHGIRKPQPHRDSSSLAAKAIRASSAYRDSSLSSAYGHSSRSPNPAPTSSSPSVSLQDSRPSEYTSMKSLNESKHGFWGALARKAKAILDEDSVPQQIQTPESIRPHVPGTTPTGKVGYQDFTPKYQNSSHSDERRQKIETPKFQKGLGAIASSLNYIGGTIGNALEEGMTIVESRTADIIQETRKHIRKKPGGYEVQNEASNHSSTWQHPQMQSHIQTDQELQLKASRDVAMAMAAKAKLLLRELKTVKADLAFAKERCAQLEEENKILRENRERGRSLEDDDLIRLQLETLLAEKARLAHENSIYARENRFLREVVEYHQLTMQDVVYLDEGSEEVTEVYPVMVPPGSNLNSVSSASSPQLSSALPSGALRK
ncbi:uncharacterized protein LOC122292307 isoform X1 [Carya illinoinensis]|uniref:Uncharacterized protein n=1 Tax=Carya illinoinensis TaxID=32201 RepID=A0A8T1NPA4_CARIL|nr:uncharacterized protein LOC122292307 isoform X1 [Carya illinoinensis]KAG6631004.1 hypothetical protein CIPAW_13G060300 [Carya illinoinensis]